MATYREQIEAMSGIRVRVGESLRIDCPFCGGRKTFTITRKDDGRVWNCYKASCGTRGGQSDTRTDEAVRRRLAGTEETRQSRSDPIPQHLSNPRNHDRVMDYLATNGCMFAFEEGLVKIRYSPAENRVLFFFPHGEGAVGRFLGRRRPKWKVYGNTAGILPVGSGRIGVIVEDAASACSVSRFSECSGCALLGTSLTSSARTQLRAYEQLIVALDKDASKKALQMRKTLTGRVPTRVALLGADLKHCDPQEIRERLGL